MRWTVLVGLSGAFVGFGLGFAVAKDNVQSSANFYAQISDGECGLEFTIANRNRTVKGSIAWTDLGLRLRLPEKGFVAVNGKVSESEAAIFNAMVALKGLAVGFYDGTILPIDLTGLDPKDFAACVRRGWRILNGVRNGLRNVLIAAVGLPALEAKIALRISVAQTVEAG
jgi:hypothetical protein